jgi:hypothetical protein
VLGQDVTGLLFAMVALVPLALGARAARRRLVPQWGGPEAWVCDIVICLTEIVLVAEFMGTIGLFARLPLTIALGVCGGSLALALRRADELSSTSARTSVPAPHSPPWIRVGLLCVAVGALAGTWGVLLSGVLRNGMQQTDTNWYHMPIAARFVQDASTWHIHYIDRVGLVSWYPATSEMFHALFMTYFGSDGFSPLLNIGWLALAMLAAWCIGRPFGLAIEAVAGAAVVFSSPVVVFPSAGSAENDMIGAALLLCVVGILVQRPGDDAVASRDWLARAWIGGAAAGIAVSAKLTNILPALVLIAVVGICAERTVRRRCAGGFTVAVVLTGSYWYLRNLYWSGSPLPRTASMIPIARLGNSVFRDQYFFPAFPLRFGTAWPFMVAIPIVACVAATVMGGNRARRAVGALGLACVGGYLLSPQVASNAAFSTTLRYGVFGLAVGFIAFPIVAARWERTGVLVASSVLALLAMWNVQIQFRTATTSGMRDGWLALAAAVAAIVAGRVLGSRDWHAAAIRSGAAVGIVAVVACIGAFGFAQKYEDDAWRNQPVTHARIATVDITTQYPLYGRDFSNYVQVLGTLSAHGAWRWPAASCRSWRQLLVDGRYDYLATMHPSAQYVAWTPSTPQRVVVGGAPVWLYKIRTPLSVAC